MNTEKFIKELLKKYPEAEIQDICKALYQSTMGSGHVVNDISSCTERIQKEFESMESTDEDIITELDGEYVRISLSILNKGLSAQTLAHMFSLSQEEDTCASCRLERKMEDFLSLCKDEKLFDYEEAEKFITSWKQEGYPSLHHSEKYRNTYHPAYRLIRKEMVTWLPVIIRMDQMLKDNQKITLAIDGHCGSGKTTCGVFLNKLYDSNLIHVDDFYLQKHQRTRERYEQPGGNFDRERLEEEVLIPIKENRDIDYHWFDCYTLTLQDLIHLPHKNINIIEGSYSMYPSLRSYYNLSLFIDIDPDKQLERIAKRNPDNYQDFVDKWIPYENTYFDTYHVKEACDIVIEN